MKKTLIIFLTILPSIFFGQRPGMDMGDWGKPKASSHIGEISGKLIDAETGQPLSFANVRLFRFNDILLEGTISDQDGTFEFAKLALANGYLLINYMGYEETRVEVTLNRNKKVEYLRKIKVSRSSVPLQEVSIEEDKPIYESKMEKIIYNAENDLNESLDDAADVLRKAPLLSVDMEGDVSLRGSKDIKFLVNGKESTFFSGSPADALKMIPADQVKSVEVITSPTAKYDGEGGAGIINIITKQKQITGFNASVNGSTGTRVNRQSVNLNFGKGRFGLSSRAMVRYGWELPGQGFSFTYDSTSTSTLIQLSDTRRQWIGFGGNIEMYYDINPYNSIISSIGYRGQKRRNKSWAQDSLYFSDFNLENKDQIAEFIDSLRLENVLKVNRYTDDDRLGNSYEWTTDYVKKFSDHEDREFRLALQLSGDVQDDDTYVLTSMITNETYNDTVWNRNDANPITIVGQLDYTHPIEDKHTLEFGAKYIDRDMTTQYSTLEEGFYTQPYEQFNYNQKIIAGYLSTKWTITKKIGLVGGIRFENTLIEGRWNENINGDWIKNDDADLPFKNEYLTVLPNIILSKKIDMGTSLKASYNKRLSRPGIRYINTNSVNTDPLTREVGNPFLQPSLTHNIEIGYNNFSPEKKHKGSYYVFAQHSENLIEPFSTREGDTTITEYRNLATNNTLGVNYYGSIKWNKLSLRGGINLYTFQTKSLSDLGRLLYNWNMGATYELGSGYKIESWGFYRSPTATTQGYIPSFSMVSIGAKKEFNNKKGSIGLRLIEPFKKFKSFESEIVGDQFYRYSNNETLFRSIGISIKYTFGEMKFKAIKDRTNISNDDLMEDSGGGEGDF